jgi:hypothetical protein
MSHNIKDYEERAEQAEKQIQNLSERLSIMERNANNTADVEFKTKLLEEVSYLRIFICRLNIIQASRPPIKLRKR